MSALDNRADRPTGDRTGPPYERRVDPGTQVRQNIDPPSRLAPPPPKTPMVVPPKPARG